MICEVCVCSERAKFINLYLEHVCAKTVTLAAGLALIDVEQVR